MRTTIRIDDHILAETKKAALEANLSLTAMIEMALKEMLFRKKTVKSKPFKLITFKGNGVKHGIDIDDSANLLEIMEEA